MAMRSGSATCETSPEKLELALRAFAVPDIPRSNYDPPEWSRRHPDTMLVFDTETTLQPEQRLTFGSARVYRPRDPRFGDDRGGFECYGEYLFYGDSISQADLEVLRDLYDRMPLVDYHRLYSQFPNYTFKQGVRAVHVNEDLVPFVLLPRDRFVREAFMPMATRARSMVVGFNLPFDLSRLAFDWTDVRRPRRRKDEAGRLPARRTLWDTFEGGIGLLLAQLTGSEVEDTHKPRIAIKTMDSKRHFIEFRAGEGDERDVIEGVANPDGTPKRRTFRGHFLDLRTFAFALTNESHSLRSACKTFGTEHGKDEHEPTGLVTPAEIAYGRHDTRATFELAEKLLAEYSRHPISPDQPATTRAAKPTQATQAYSPASIGKAYLRAMGITPPLKRWPDFPLETVGHAMTAFYGGRAECRIRRVPLPVRYVDFTSMYPTVNGLMGLWELLTAARLKVVDATVDVVKLLTNLSVDQVSNQAFWPQLRVLVEIEPGGEILPTRGAYDGEGHGWQIGVNPLTSDQPLFYALPDLVAATLLSGRPPTVRQAWRLEPEGKSRGMHPVALRGEVVVNPRREDFFAAVVERRNSLPDREGANKPLSDFLKVLANATSYGIFAEMVRHELPAKEKLSATVHGLAEPYPWPVHAPEEPGGYAFPPLAALITSAARLILALLERAVTDHGGRYVMVDTDSMAIVATEAGGLVACPGGSERLAGGQPAIKALSWTEVDELRKRFSSGLNPYRKGAVADILKLEDHNFAPDPTEEAPERVDRSRPVQLHAFAISAKRYALFNLDADGAPVIRKASEHGLGHLLNPDDPNDRTGRIWIKTVWRNMVVEASGKATVRLGFESRPALSRLAVSSMALLNPFRKPGDEKRHPDRLVRPFNFMLSANVAPFGHPPGSDPARFHLIAPYQRDPSKWLRMRWIDRYAKPPTRYSITTRLVSGDLVRVKSIADVLAEYRVHPEPKSLGPDGEICGPTTIGLLHRRPVRAGSFTYIGKEANEIDDVEAGLVHDLGDVQLSYGLAGDPWPAVLATLRQVPTGELAHLTGVARRTIQRTLSSTTQPRQELRRRLIAIARDVEPFRGPKRGVACRPQ